MAGRCNLDSFLEEFSPLSEALIAAIVSHQQAPTAITSFFITNWNEKCFKPFASRCFNGIGSIRISSALDEIRGMGTLLMIFLIICQMLKSKKSSFLEAMIT